MAKQPPVKKFTTQLTSPTTGSRTTGPVPAQQKTPGTIKPPVTTPGTKTPGTVTRTTTTAKKPSGATASTSTIKKTPGTSTPPTKKPAGKTPPTSGTQVKAAKLDYKVPGASVSVPYEKPDFGSKRIPPPKPPGGGRPNYGRGKKQKNNMRDRGKTSCKVR
jgi:hypothetical protein